jgi:hypothetical protein
MAKRIVLAGGSGFLGTVLSRRFQAAGWDVIVISRSAPKEPGRARFLPWDGKTPGDWAAALEGADLVVNLAGRSVDCRYHAKNRAQILASRVDSTALLGRAIGAAGNPPRLWINSSTATWYRDSLDRPMDEFTGETGTGFSVEVARAWEKAFFSAEAPRTRKAALRISIVLGREGGAMKTLRNLVKCGLGGTQGSGRQMFSWIHEEDFFEIVRFVEARGLEGAVNCAAPQAVDNREFMRELRQALGVPFGLPAPEWILKIGTFLLRTEAELVLKSRWVAPARLLKEGFRFKHPELPEALADLFSKARLGTSA